VNLGARLRTTEDFPGDPGDEGQRSRGDLDAWFVCAQHLPWLGVPPGTEGPHEVESEVATGKRMLYVTSLTGYASVTTEGEINAKETKR
jgi:hypothetical protein